MTDRPVDLSFLKDEAVKYIDLSSLRIANCVGCFGCWTKTPGKCVIRDDATWVYPCIAASNTVLYVSRLCYGGYDSVMKTMLERAIPVQQAFIRIYKGETHHVQRAVMPKKSYYSCLRRYFVRRKGPIQKAGCPQCSQYEL